MRPWMKTIGQTSGNFELCATFSFWQQYLEVVGNCLTGLDMKGTGQFS